MKRTVVVISDVHLGGRQGFQMMENPHVLAEFLHWLRLRVSTEQMELVINGDFLDFLAEDDVPESDIREATWTSLSPNGAAALSKLDRIVAQNAEVFSELRGFVGAGGRLRILIGNHDLEIAYPGVVESLLERLCPGNVSVITDWCAHTVGPVVIEHGNVYDDWNLYPHPSISLFRFEQSRGTGRNPLTPPPGSELVARVMNDAKRAFGFIDQLKPEIGLAVPLLLLLAPRFAGRIDRVASQFVRSRLTTQVGLGLDARVQVSRAEQPEHWTYLNDAINELPERQRVQIYEYLQESRTQVSLADVVDSTWQAGVSMAAESLVRRVAASPDPFGTGDELDPDVLRGAKWTLGKGAQVVVFGHTHFAKKVSIEDRETRARGLYVNTGTWSNLMRVPRDEPEEGWSEWTGRLLSDLRENTIASRKLFRPTFAHIVLEWPGEGQAVPPEAEVKNCELYEFGGLLDPMRPASVWESRIVGPPTPRLGLSI